MTSASVWHRHCRLTARECRFGFLDWEKAAKDLVAALRSEAGRNPHDRALIDLVGELSTRSEPFRKWWAAHNVRYHNTGRKRLHHPTVGDLELDYEVMQLTADAGLSLAIFSAEPSSRSAEALDLLASWVATPAGNPGAPSTRRAARFGCKPVAPGSKRRAEPRQAKGPERSLIICASASRSDFAALR
jgi:hypothetical protein